MQHEAVLHTPELCPTLCITYLIDGRFRHRDSKGGGGVLTAGTVQWMTAGRGIVHSEMPDMDKGMLWGYQLWLTLPAKDKMVPPRYQHLAADAMPVMKRDGASVKIIAGSFDGATGPAKTWFPIDYFDVRLDSASRFQHDVAAEPTCLLYVHSGSVIADPDGEMKEARRGDFPDSGMKHQDHEDHKGFFLILQGWVVDLWRRAAITSQVRTV